MNYYTNENDLNKFNGYMPNHDNKNKSSISVLEMFVTSIIRIKQLAKLSIENSSRFVWYVIFMALLYSIMSFAVPTASRIYSFGGFTKLFTDGIPKISVNDGVLTADKKFEMSLSNADIILDTGKNSFTRDDFDTSGVYIAIGSRNIKMISYVETEDSSSYNEIYSYPIGMVLPNGTDNDVLRSIAPVFYIMLFVIFVIEAVVAAVKYLFFALLYAFFTRSTTAISKLNMTMKDSFHLCFYAQTISIILVTLNEVSGHFIPSLIMSIAGIFITIAVIMSAIKPHLPDIDEFLDNFGGDL